MAANDDNYGIINSLVLIAMIVQAGLLVLPEFSQDERFRLLLISLESGANNLSIEYQIKLISKIMNFLSFGTVSNLDFSLISF